LKIQVTRRGATLPRREDNAPGKSQLLAGQGNTREVLPSNNGKQRVSQGTHPGGYPFGDPELPGRQSGRFLHRHAVEDQQLAMYRIPLLALTHRSISR
jgi:hypothetical protein